MLFYSVFFWVNINIFTNTVAKSNFRRENPGNREEKRSTIAFERLHLQCSERYPISLLNSDSDRSNPLLEVFFDV